jgi:oligogalacturonide lyase
MAALLGSYAFAASKTPSKRTRPLPQVGEFIRIVDPLTENIVVRLTDPRFQSHLPAPVNRFISSQERFILYSSNKPGRLAPFLADLRSGRARQLAAPESLVPESLCLDERERSLYLIDGTTLKEIALSNLKERTVAPNVGSFALWGHPPQIYIVRQNCLLRLSDGKTLAEGVSMAQIPVRPGGGGCLFGRRRVDSDQEFWYAPFSAGRDEKPRMLARGKIWNPFWNPNGRSLLFLRAVDVNGVSTTEIHEAVPDAAPDVNLDQRVSRTSQFAAFAPNGDGSVFVGASRSKAQPAIDLLLRSTPRELTLCEHRAASAQSASPVFSPDSRRVYFQSDREGNPALYAVNVELLVEPTL